MAAAAEPSARRRGAPPPFDVENAIRSAFLFPTVATWHSAAGCVHPAGAHPASTRPGRKWQHGVSYAPQVLRHALDRCPGSPAGFAVENFVATDIACCIGRAAVVPGHRNIAGRMANIGCRCPSASARCPRPGLMSAPGEQSTVKATTSKAPRRSTSSKAGS